MALISALAGWIGAFGLLIAFYLNATKKIDSQSRLYILMNLFCSLLLVGNACMSKAYPFIVINIFWVLVSANSYFNLIKNNKSTFSK